MRLSKSAREMVGIARLEYLVGDMAILQMLFVEFDSGITCMGTESVFGEIEYLYRNGSTAPGESQVFPEGN